MDGRFVPNITIGPLIVEALRPVTDKPLDCHLVSYRGVDQHNEFVITKVDHALTQRPCSTCAQMIVEPELRIADFIKAGADIISVHAEPSSTIHLHRTLNQVCYMQERAGIVTGTHKICPWAKNTYHDWGD